LTLVLLHFIEAARTLLLNRTLLNIVSQLFTVSFCTLRRGPAKTLPPRGAGWEPERLAFQS